MDAVVERLREVVEAPNWFRFPDTEHRLFEGAVTPPKFSIRRIVFFKNSLLPRISGTLQAHEDKTRISLKMHPHPLAIGFLVIWTSGVLFFAAAMVIAAVSDRSSAWIMLVPAGMLAWLALLLNFGFSREAEKAKELLKLVTLSSEDPDEHYPR